MNKNNLIQPPVEKLPLPNPYHYDSLRKQWVTWEGEIFATRAEAKAKSLGEFILGYDPFITSNEPILDSAQERAPGLWQDAKIILGLATQKRIVGRERPGFDPSDPKAGNAGPFRMPIIYPLLESRDMWTTQGVTNMSAVMQAPRDYLDGLLKAGSPTVYAFLVMELWKVMDQVDSTLVFPRLTMATTIRTEEKAFSSFLIEITIRTTFINFKVNSNYREINKHPPHGKTTRTRRVKSPRPAFVLLQEENRNYSLYYCL